MRRRRFCSPVDLGCSAFAGFRFPPEVIVLAVRRGHYELGIEAEPRLRVAAAFKELGEAI
jgi:hypothetical protein